MIWWGYSEKKCREKPQTFAQLCLLGGLGIWGIRLTPFSQDEYHRRIDEAYRRRHTLKALEKDAKARGDDVDLEQRMAALNWHPRLPAPLEEFPSKVNFTLSPGRN
jgi:hypothetical protein